MGLAIRLPGAWPSESCEGWQRIHELIAGTGFYVQMAGGVNFYNQAQAVHSKGIISALGLFLGGYLLRLRGRRIAMKRTATKKTTKKKSVIRPGDRIILRDKYFLRTGKLKGGEQPAEKTK